MKNRDSYDRNELSKHCGIPVKGYKYAFNIWFRKIQKKSYIKMLIQSIIYLINKKSDKSN